MWTSNLGRSDTIAFPFHHPSMSWLLSSILLLLLHVLFLVNCDALRRNDGNCDSSSCGNIQNIRYPFRFEGDPENCGKKIYELACHNNHPVLNLFSGGKYNYVKAINYNNYTI
ncbi:hypothetical protein ACSBR1_027777 [Camellia fascicularis]